jgi:signal peptidase
MTVSDDHGGAVMATVETVETVAGGTVRARGVRTTAHHARARSGRAGIAVGGVLLSLLLVVLATAVSAVAVVPRVIGAVPLTVLTGSMQPTYNPGDLVVVRPVAAEAIAVGDVVTFQPTSDDPTLVTHRVIEVRTGAAGAVSGFVTQGDANSAVDAPIVPDQVMGRVVYAVPLIGHLTHATLGPQLAMVAGVALLGYGLAAVAVSGRTERRTKSRPTKGRPTNRRHTSSRHTNDMEMP